MKANNFMTIYQWEWYEEELSWTQQRLFDIIGCVFGLNSALKFFKYEEVHYEEK